MAKKNITIDIKLLMERLSKLKNSVIEYEEVIPAYNGNKRVDGIQILPKKDLPKSKTYNINIEFNEDGSEAGIGSCYPSNINEGLNRLFNNENKSDNASNALGYIQRMFIKK